MKELFNLETLLGKVSINVDEDAQRQVPYLYFHGIFTPAKGKKPSSIFTMTVSDYKSLSGSVGVIPGEAVSKLVAFSQPLINAAAKSDSEVIRTTFQAIDKMVAEHDATKESASGPVERKIEDNIVGLLARAFLVVAGKSGEIPETLDVSGYLSKARTEAFNMAETLGKDDLGQFRLKKAKVAKAATPAVTEGTMEDLLDLEEGQ